MNGEASSIHGNLRLSSILTSESGEWKLGGFELLSSVKDEDDVFISVSRSAVIVLVLQAETL